MQLTCSYDTGAKALGPEKTISGKLQETLTSATQQARAVDEQRGISKTATDVRFSYCTPLPTQNWRLTTSRSTPLQYYSRALSSPFGLKVKAFYTTTSKQVLDIHEEARRIHETHKAAAAPAAPAPNAASAPPPPADAPKTAEAPTVV